MLLLIRHALAIAVLPFTVTVLVPLWVARRNGVTLRPPASWLDFALILAGALAAAVGGWLFVWSLYNFAARGRGTLAPWDPPRALVVEGPYRFVRNPMISGVIFILVAEALWLRSVPHGVWAAVFFATNAAYIPLIEEPMLRARFGAAYDDYCRAVRRLLPRLRPHRITASASSSSSLRRQ
jgi:protein-S-isoprenylcysteine O-methyltransferase Ste14